MDSLFEKTYNNYINLYEKVALPARLDPNNPLNKKPQTQPAQPQPSTAVQQPPKPQVGEATNPQNVPNPNNAPNPQNPAQPAQPETQAQPPATQEKPGLASQIDQKVGDFARSNTGQIIFNSLGMKIPTDPTALQKFTTDMLSDVNNKQAMTAITHISSTPEGQAFLKTPEGLKFAQGLITKTPTGQQTQQPTQNQFEKKV